eukprot:2240176-Amphidinium_carterae.1
MSTTPRGCVSCCPSAPFMLDDGRVPLREESREWRATSCDTIARPKPMIVSWALTNDLGSTEQGVGRWGCGSRPVLSGMRSNVTSCAYGSSAA